MFDNISGRYDFLNRFLSLGIDRGWRKQCIRILNQRKPQNVLDVATGTADLAIALAKLPDCQITGVDISEGMLAVGQKKIDRLGKGGQIRLQAASAESLPFGDNTFDAVSVAFGVRNFENTLAGLREMNRVLKPGGMLLVLEFSKPSKFPVKQLYNFYFRYILPFFGRLISGDKTAYTYLPASVNAFPEGENFTALLGQSGYVQTEIKRLSFGICSIYTGIKS